MILPRQSLFYHPLLPLAHSLICTPRTSERRTCTEAQEAEPSHSPNTCQVADREMTKGMAKLQAYLCQGSAFFPTFSRQRGEQIGRRAQNIPGIWCSPQALQVRHFFVIICYVSNIHVNFTFYCTEYSCLFNVKVKLLPHACYLNFSRKTDTPGSAYAIDFYTLERLTGDSLIVILAQFERLVLCFPP